MSRGGTFSITATDSTDNLTHFSSDFFVSGPAELAWSAAGQPNGGTATTPWTTQPQLSVEDGHGTVISTSTASMHLAVKAGTGQRALP